MIGRCLAFAFLLGTASELPGQALPTASRLADAQVGVGFTSVAKPGYVQESFRGIAAYVGLDFKAHFGVEADFHQAGSSSGDQFYQRTYEIGARYFRTYGPIVPYVRGIAGRGVLNYQYSRANLAYNLFAGAAGADVKVGPYLRVRGEYEYQRWIGFQNGSVEPRLITVGIAYHFAGKRRYGR